MQLHDTILDFQESQQLQQMLHVTDNGPLYPGRRCLMPQHIA